MMRVRIAGLAVWMTLVTACGGPSEPPPPPQSVDSYWIGIDQAGDVHLHITLTQSGTTLGLLPGCFVERCSFYPFSPAGATAIGSDFPVEVKTVSGTFSNPAITFSFSLANGRSFTFTGTVSNSSVMTGRISGTTLSDRPIVFGKTE